MKLQKRDSGVDLYLSSSSEKFKFVSGMKNDGNAKIKNKKSSAEKVVVNRNDIHFKSGMIFDLEM